jgi:uncharacterized protein (DUF58 family)
LKSPAQIATKAFRAWQTRKFGSVDPRPHRIDRRRIYILPTGFGLILATLDLAMLIAALNYNNNLGLAFAFLMASIALVAMHHCHRNLLGLCVDAKHSADGFAGGSAPLEFVLHNSSGLDRYELEIRCGEGALAAASVAAAGRQPVTVHAPLARRGVQELAQFELATRYPFGWFRAWTYVQTPISLYAAPQPQGQQQIPAQAAVGSTGGGSAAGDEEFAGLRAYVPGMPLKHMAWKVVAAGREAAVRSYSGMAAQAEWLDWLALAELETEARLSQLCRWVLDADASGRSYGLRLPHTELGPASGNAHRRACLRALAEFDAAAAP